MINRILIANRGEIAYRIICTCHILGIKAGIIYSKEDKGSLAVKNACEAFLLNPENGENVYLDIDQIIDIAVKRGFDAIHPGYGFLSENSQFARKCNENNIIFIGPDPETIELACNKDLTKKLAKKCDIPVIEELNPDELTENDFPLLLKASRGGGGRGIRIVDNWKDLKRLIGVVKRESDRANKKSKVLIEKYIHDARHIEIQILADKYGKIVHLFERECTIQRRNQKVIEEAPLVSIPNIIKKKLRKYAKDLAKKMRYKNAGTFEFLVSRGNQIFFLEVNPRIQVEHTVTEEVTGIDIVKEQIRIADGKHLSFTQSEIKNTGHSIECRVTAENVMNNLSPTFGKIFKCVLPLGKDIRIDGDVYAGKIINSNYDSLLLKLIVSAENRSKAIIRMRQALNELEIVGINTNISLLRAIFANSLFEKNKISTRFIEKQQLLETAKKMEKERLDDYEIDFRELELQKIALITASIYKEMEQKLGSKITPWLQKARMTQN